MIDPMAMKTYQVKVIDGPLPPGALQSIERTQEGYSQFLEGRFLWDLRRFIAIIRS
jgi:hypothetical protein